jgi:hypothetical protein
MNYYRLFQEADRETVMKLKLRASDEAEVKAAFDGSIEEALTSTLANSEIVWVVIHKDQIEGLFGLDVRPGYGVPWFVATDKFSDFAFSFVKESKKVINIMLEIRPILLNLVDYRHVESIRWLKWLGFRIYEDVDFYLKDPDVPFKLSIKEKDK